jgi:hypothetical protein
MQEAMVIIGKALILNKVPSDDAHKISLVSMDILHKTIGEIVSHPWVLAVRGMYLFREELIKYECLTRYLFKLFITLANQALPKPSNASLSPFNPQHQ